MRRHDGGQGQVASDRISSAHARAPDAVLRNRPPAMAPPCGVGVARPCQPVFEPCHAPFAFDAPMA